MALRFSQRIGKKPVKVNIQIDSMDNDLKVGLWNILYKYILGKYDSSGFLDMQLVESVWTEFLRREVQEFIGVYPPEITRIIKNAIYEGDYLEIYDLIDYISQVDNSVFKMKNFFICGCEIVLERELSGYRFINGLLTPIIDELEIQSITNAIDSTDDLNISGAKVHLRSALELLSDRIKPDHRNSIKESISAVESVCQFLTGDENASLGKALSTLNGKKTMHTSLLDGYKKIYGYTGNADGIRHGMLDESNLTLTDSTYMLVSCSAFINYLIQKSSS